MKPNPSHSEKGSLVLVVLCLLAVLGIALASYLSVSSQSMKMSNRSYAADVSRHLAEMGLERAIRSFNYNTFGSWTVSGNTASQTFTITTSHYGTSGITGSVKVRVDNYNAYNQTATWDSTGNTNYQINDLVGYNGMWYRCVKAHSTPAKTPSIVATSGNLAYWVPAPMPWQWRSNSSYALREPVCYSGNWYRVTTAHTSGSAWSATNWTSIPAFLVTYDPFVHNTNEIFSYPNSNTWYLWNSTANYDYNTSSGLSWQYESARTYNFNDVVCYYTSSAYNWYRCKVATSSGVAPTSITNWENALSASWDWNSGDSYKLNDVVYYSGSFYRCIQAHSTSHTPPNASYWSTNPLASFNWDAGKSYSQGDTVSYNGLWYLAILGYSQNQNPSTATTYWQPANTTSTTYKWNSTTAYSAGDVRCYGGAWYSCTTANTGKSPNDSTYWTALAAPVIYAEGTATLPDSTATVKTQLRATVSTAPLFPNAIAATETLAINGAGTVDSYDSTLNTTPSSFGYSAVLAATGTTNPALTVTSTTVKGYVAAPSSATTPYAPMWTYGGSTSVTGSAASGVDLTRVSRSPYIPQFDPQSVVLHTVIPPTLPTTLNLGTPGAVTPSIYTYQSGLTLGATNINILGPVILDIQGGLTIGSTGVITIASTGSAEIHLSGSLQITSSGIDNSTTKDPKKLILICTGNSGTSQYTATPSFKFYGTIYMPNNSASNVLTMGSGTIYGAISAKNITFSGDANVHYDTSLRYASIPGVDQPYVISEWRELTDQDERAILP